MSNKEEAFKDWIGNPVTEFVIKYLNDSIKEASEMMADEIANGSIINEKDMIRTATMCITLKRIAELDYTEIEDFYTKDEE